LITEIEIDPSLEMIEFSDDLSDEVLDRVMTAASLTCVGGCSCGLGG